VWLLGAPLAVLGGTSVAVSPPAARLAFAYSGVAQLSFITLGIFSRRPEGAQGALLRLLNHGLVTAPLFLIVAALPGRPPDAVKRSQA